MHELPVAESILEIATRHARQAQARRITVLHLIIGQLSSILDESVQFYWDIIAKDTLAEGAKLDFKRIPLEMECLDCQHRYAPAELEPYCPKCNSPHVKIAAGEEFLLESIEVE